MRLLRNIALIVFPVLIMINLYRFVMLNQFGPNMYEFRGLSYLHQYISTFNGLTNTFQTLDKIGTYANLMLSSNDVNIFETIALGFMMLFYVFAIPVTVVIDVVVDIIWVINMFASV